ncbi:5-formyltetrahydrofolate cyclo-ligase [Nitrogeniibacter mangrovi]|uniref:5-formyltetrahydrofolate cyclo-ligase n=1 Tax=Nitrogeniibacter mangrovi TaxID=2016596 RepID=A0A6C1AYP4_9RHOO|nr:5-formyltetrahydrofolate cyclo-ligase [Nitrogeniibacter mangrovi]QID16492.1 5-formyltetrahydrofolate cyclo-ligase [Nitrogeniibacter mangrovi]
MDKQRKSLRNDAIARREALSPAHRTDADRAIAAALDELIARLAPTTLGFCWPHRGEPDMRAFVIAWLAADAARRAALPVVVAPDQPMVFREWTASSEMIPDRHGIPMPADGEVLHPDVLLVPLNAFDDAGFRLGYGGGYFDRTLERMAPTPVTIGLGYELGRVSTTHPQPHDHPMDWLVTETGAHPAAIRQRP